MSCIAGCNVQRNAGIDDALLAFGEAMDREGLVSIREELKRLFEEKEDQQERGNMDRAEEIGDEIAKILLYLGGVEGKGGQPRRIGGEMQKIRSRIGMNMKRVREAIGENLPDLKEYLSRRISGKGGYAYIPDPDHALEWNFGES